MRPSDRIPRAFSTRAQWGHSNAAVKRRIEKIERSAGFFDGLLQLFNRLFHRAKPQFRPGPAPKEYRIDV